MKKSFIFLGLFIALICLVGAVSGATETLTVVYDTLETHPFSMTSGGHTYITVKAPDNTYHYYAPAPVDDLLTASLSGGTWETVQKLGNYDSNGDVVIVGDSTDGYLYSNANGQIIDTGVNPVTTRVVFGGKSTGTTSTDQIYVGLGVSRGQYAGVSSDNKWELGIVKSSISSYTFVNYDVTFTVSSTKVTASGTINGVSISDTTATSLGIAMQTYKLFKIFATSGRTTYSYPINGNLYYAKFYDSNSVKIRDYIPIQIGNTYCLYDKCLSGNVIYGNNGTGSFSGGGTPTPLTYTHIIPDTPSISSITVTSSSPAPVGSTVQVSATLTNVNEAGTVQFYTSTDGSQWSTAGNAVSIASGATSATQTFTGSSTAGLYYVKAILTVGSTTFDSHTSGVSDGQVKLLGNPTFTTQPSFDTSIGTLSATPIMGFVANANNLQDSSVSLYVEFTQISGTGGTSGIAGINTYDRSTGVWTIGDKQYTYSDTDSTNHTYTATVYTYVGSSWSDPNKRVIGTVTSNPYSFQTFAPPATPTAEINPSTITINTQTAITLNATSYPTAPAGNAYTYQWKYGDSSTPSAGDTNITTAETTLTNPATWSGVTFASTGTKYVYLKITDSLSQTVYSQSQTLTITNIQASVVWATTYHGMSDNINLVINGHQLGNSYTWYYQDTTGTEWTQIGTTYSYNYVKTPSQMGLTSGHTYRFKAVFNGVDLTAQNTLTPYESPIPATPGAPLQPIAIPYTITLTASVTNPATVDSYKWQIQNGASWQDVSTGEQYSTAINNPGNYVYRFVAIGKNGYSVNSESVTVQAGYAPSARITAPETGSQYDAGARINVGATVGGTQATYTWNFGDGTQSTGTTTGTINEQSTTISSYVQYTKVKGSKTITLTVSNIYGTSATYTIHVENGKSSMRPTATGTVTPVDSSGIYNLINNTAPQSASNPLPNMSGMISDLTKPITSIIGEWFYLLIFAVPYLIIFLRQKNILIPSILGVLFAGFLFIMLPGVAMKASIGILILSIAGGVFGLYVKRHS